MERIRERLDEFVVKVKQQNPDANWANLLTGVGILILIAVFSIWYFGKGSSLGGEDVAGFETGSDRSIFAEGYDMEGNVIVQKGEGLWQVAERVCGDGELYNYVALENDMSHLAVLETGQKLKVSCDYDVIR